MSISNLFVPNGYNLKCSTLDCGTLNAAAVAYNDLRVNNNLDVDNDLEVGNDATVTGALIVTGGSSFSGESQFPGNITVLNAGVTNLLNTTITGAATVVGQATVNGQLNAQVMKLYNNPPLDNQSELTFFYTVQRQNLAASGLFVVPEFKYDAIRINNYVVLNLDASEETVTNQGQPLLYTAIDPLLRPTGDRAVPLLSTTSTGTTRNTVTIGTDGILRMTFTSLNNQVVIVGAVVGGSNYQLSYFR